MTACGAKTRTGGRCAKSAGWGTTHPGAGRCKRRATMTTDNARFLSFVADEEDGCRVWTGGLTGAGYGAFWVDGRQVWRTCRACERARRRRRRAAA